MLIPLVVPLVLFLLLMPLVVAVSGYFTTLEPELKRSELDALVLPTHTPTYLVLVLETPHSFNRREWTPV